MPVIKKISLVILILFILLSTGTVLAEQPADEPVWTVIAPGIEYQKFTLPDPNNIFVVRMDRTNQNVTLESSIANGKLAEGRETVSEMYSRYDQALNFWGGSSNPPNWGERNQVVVAINGSYFDYSNGMPQGGQVQSGWYAKRFDNLGGWSGFSWKLDRSAFIGECVFHRPEKQVITYPATGNVQQITQVNTIRGTDELVMYTSHYNTRTGTSNAGVEVVVEMARPTMILPSPAYASGIVRQIRNNEGNSLIPFNSIVLSAVGNQAPILLANVQVGSEVRISQEITSYLPDCSTPEALNWTKTYSSVQGAFFYLKDEQIRDFNDPGATNRNPRTAIAYNEHYIFFIVVDGRDAEHSIGMTIHQLALFTRDTLTATSAVAQDGGGSSTMVINGLVVNNTFCNNYVCTNSRVYLPLIKNNSDTTPSAVPVNQSIIRSPAGIERAVANGMLMVITQPGEFSTKFSPGKTVTTLANVDLRLGPGTNYAAFTTLPQGTHGVIADQMNGLNGVLAKSGYWWYVNFSNASGWVSEDVLSSQVVPGQK
jgi:hypothetical protein